MCVWLAVRGDLPLPMANGLTVAVRRAVPDHEELRVWDIGLSHGTDKVDQEDEARHYHSGVAAARYILILSVVCREGAHHKGAETDGNEENPENSPRWTF